MANNSVIQVDNLSKKYTLGHAKTKGDGLRHEIERAVLAPFRWLASSKNGRGASAKNSDEFWALRDIGFDVAKGEVVGIIGHNGAGKSTLLKLLSRITEPTTGSIRLRGRVASLLEVGTGFHPELTGRENVFLNGAILGMGRQEIIRKFDEIVAFAEVERFLDTPVKRYSSGMYVRLAFSVAAHLEPEILIVDEVLAVGDASFQKKCLGKMEEVAGEGRTVLFVSHNMPMIANLCSRGILLKAGSIVDDGPIDQVIYSYTSEVSALAGLPVEERLDRSGSGAIIVTRLEFLGEDSRPRTSHSTGQQLTIRLHYRSRGDRNPECRAGISIMKGGAIYTVLSTWTSTAEPFHFSKEGYVDFLVERLPLTAGEYSIDCFLEGEELFDVVSHAATLTVGDGDYFRTGRVLPSPFWKGVGVLVDHSCSHVAGSRSAETAGLLAP